ncbi:MAG: sulfotransferase [Rhizobiaceae bacterium]
MHSKLTVNERLRRARKAIKNSDLDTANLIVTEILQEYPHNRRASELLRELDQGVSSPPVSEVVQSKSIQIRKLLSLFQAAKFKEAMAFADALISRYPKEEIIHGIQGASAASLGQTDIAIRSFMNAVEINPENPNAHVNLGTALLENSDPDKALIHLEKALELDPELFEGHNNLANALAERGSYERAAKSFEKAISIRPEKVEIYNNLGLLHQEWGHFEEAKSTFNRALDVDPNYAQVHFNLSLLYTYTPDHPHLAQMCETLASMKDESPNIDLVHFAMGKAHDDIADYNTAFIHLEKGNAIRKKQLQYDIRQDEDLFNVIKSKTATSREVTDGGEQFAQTGNVIPMFITGLPRSGTTLVERILDQHSSVHAAGELNYLDEAVKESGLLSNPFDQDRIAGITRYYMDRIERLAGDSKYVTDKMPLNFRWIGVIRQALPNARIIHVTRNATAIGWSLFRSRFSTEGNGFAYDLENIAKYQHLYRDLMDFWHEQFPGEIFNLDYEQLVENQEKVTRDLLQYLELPWENHCLDITGNQGNVKTLSFKQVRQGVYKGSSEAWKNYEKKLEPLLKRLS